MNKTLFLLAALPVFTSFAVAATVTETFNFNGLGQAIPDGNPTGLANTQSITSTIFNIEKVVISINVSGTFNGDLYGYLTHISGFAVLLNRPGTQAGDSFGYHDAGIAISFDDNAAADIHTYRNSVTPAPGTQLTGTWQPDGRNVDPNAVTNLSPRTSLLSSFQTLQGSGDWTLFVADVSSGDSHVLENWSLSITGSDVPEPGAVVMMLGAAGVLVMRRRRREVGQERGKGMI